MDTKYFQTSTNFNIRNNHLFQNSILYLQKGLLQEGCTSSSLDDLYLHNYESKFKKKNMF